MSLQKFYYIGKEYLAENVDNVNKLHTWINDNANNILAIVKSARIKNDGGLYKKDKQDLDVILATTPFRAFLSFSMFSIYLETDIQSTTKRDDLGCSTCKYIKRSIHLGQWAGNAEYVGFAKTIEPLPIYSLENVQGLIEQEKELYSIAEQKIEECYNVQKQLLDFTRG